MSETQSKPIRAMALIGNEWKDCRLEAAPCCGNFRVVTEPDRPRAAERRPPADAGLKEVDVLRKAMEENLAACGLADDVVSEQIAEEEDLIDGFHQINSRPRTPDRPVWVYECKLCRRRFYHLFRHDCFAPDAAGCPLLDEFLRNARPALAAGLDVCWVHPGMYVALTNAADLKDVGRGAPMLHGFLLRIDPRVKRHCFEFDRANRPTQ